MVILVVNICSCIYMGEKKHTFIFILLYNPPETKAIINANEDGRERIFPLLISVVLSLIVGFV